MRGDWEPEFSPIVSKFWSFPMDLDESGGAQVAYLVHDLDDAAVRRRVKLLAREGFSVGLGGFRRHSAAASAGAVGTAVDLGRTMDARLVHRARTVLRRLVSPDALAELCQNAPVIVARNLEMLVLAARVRSRNQRLIYECLDIHRMMLGTGKASQILRWLERRLLARTDLVIVSSPAFARDYFAERQGRRDRVLLIENKVPDERRHSRPSAPAGNARGVWRIGWFGMLRCRKTLEQLAALAAMSDGRIEVVVAGIPSPAEFPNFAAEAASIPGLRYLGPFRAEDLADLYARVDFVWAIDYFEEGLNSNWLLPNRLYEGLAHGAVPIALQSVETGRWLQRNGVGLLITDPLRELPQRLAELGTAGYTSMREAIAALPESTLYQTPGERREIAAAIGGYHRA